MYLVWFILSILLVGIGRSCSPEPSHEVNATCTESKDKIPLYIGGMMAVTVGWDGSGCLVAAELALEHINSRSDILPEHELKLLWNDTQCLVNKPLRALYDQVVVSEKQKIILLGPACSGGAELVSETSKYWNLITVLYSALSDTLTNRIKYPFLYRTVPIASNSFTSPTLWLIKKYGWKRLGSISQSAPAYAVAQQNFVQRASKRNVSIVTEVIEDEVKNQVENLKRLQMRIIHVNVQESNARKIFCEGNKIGLSGPDIVWLLPAWYRERWWLIEDETVDCSVEELAAIVETSLILGVDVAALSRLNKTTVSGITPGEFLNEITERLSWPRYSNYTLNNYISYTYDAVWAIALMLNRSATILKERKSRKRLEDFTYTDDDMRSLFFEEMAATDFFGTSGHVSFVKGERPGTSDISQLKGKCKSGWILHKRHCYYFSEDDVRTWSMAVTSCAKEEAYLADGTAESEIIFLAEMWSDLVNETLSEWHVGLHFMEQEINGQTQRMLFDTQNRSSDWIVVDSIPREKSHDCVFIDFKDNNSLKSGECLSEKPFICKQNAEFSLVPIALYDSLTDDVTWSQEILWPDDKVPADGPIYREIVIDRIEILLPGYIHILLSTFAVIGMVVVILLFILTVSLSSRRASLPSNSFLNYSILLGCFLVYFSVILTKSSLLSFLSDEHHILICQIRNITASVGFMLGVSTLVGKIWFVYNSTDFSVAGKVVKTGSRVVYTTIAFAVSVDVVCVIILTVFYPLNIRITPLGNEIDPADSYHVIQHFVKTCSPGDGTLPLFLAFVDKVILVLLGLFLSFEIREAPPLGDSRHVTIGIYNITVFGSCHLILTILLESAPTNLFLFCSTLVVCCTTITLIILFLPLTRLALRHGRDSSQDGRELTSHRMTSLPPSSSAQLQLSYGQYLEHVPLAMKQENFRLKAQLRELEIRAQERRTKETFQPSKIRADKKPPTENMHDMTEDLNL